MRVLFNFWNTSVNTDVEERRLQRANQRIAILERMLEEKTRQLFLEKERLKDTYEYLDNILHTGMIGIIATNDKGAISFANDAAGEFFDKTGADLLGTSLQEQLPEGIFGSLFDEDELDPLDGFQDEVILEREDGGNAVVMMSLSVIRNNAGDSLGLVCMLKDMSQRKQLERKVLNAQKLEAVGQLAAGVAHEINTPIQYVRDNIEFLQSEFSGICDLMKICRDSINSADSAEHLSTAVKETAISSSLDYLINEIPLALAQSLEGAESVAQIVRSLKLFSHPGSAEKHVVDINAALESVLVVSRNEWKYIAEIEKQLSTDLPKIVGYQSELNQAFLNLVVNAAHALVEKAEKTDQKRGTIKIRTFAEGNDVIVEVEDTGTGIPDSIARKIFDPFFTTKPMGQGTGQGLAFVHSTIVSKHKGSIDVRSKVGEGTVFSVRLPGESSK